MDSIQQEQPARACSNLGVPSLQNQMSSPVYMLADEPFPYVSGFFDDTMNLSFMTNGQDATADLPAQLKIKKQDYILESPLVANKSCLSMPVKNSHSKDLSMSIMSAQNDKEDTTNITETNSEGDGNHDPDTWCSTERCEMRGESNGSTFNIAKELSSEANCTKSLICERTESNSTFEKSTDLQKKSAGLSSTVTTDDANTQSKNENNLNSTTDICAPANVTTDQPVGKHDHTVDITQSNESNQEQNNETVASSKDSDEHGTFLKSIADTSAGVQLVADVKKNVLPSNILIGVDQSSSVNVEKVDRTVTKHNTTTDLTSLPISNLTNASVNIVETPNEELLVESSSNGDAVVRKTLEPPVQLSSAAAVIFEAFSDRPLDLPLTETKGDEQQNTFRRKNGISDDENCLNLDISHSSLFSLDDMQCPLVASTPIVFSKGFGRLGSDIEEPSITNHSKPNASKPNLPPIKSETSNQIRKASAKDTHSSTSESAIVNKPPSKLAVRSKIPQSFIKSGVSKTEVRSRLYISQTTAAVKSKNQMVAVTQPETTSTLHNVRTAQLNKGKSLASSKNTMMLSTVTTSSLAASKGGCNLPPDVKPSGTFISQPKPSGLQRHGQGRLVLKPPSTAFVLEETGQPHTSNKMNGLSGLRTRSSVCPGFSQKHVSSDFLPLAKKKKTGDAHNQPTCPDASTKGGGAQKHVTAPVCIKLKKPSGNCESCTLLRENLQAFHLELGEYLERTPAHCETSKAFQQTVERRLKEFKRIQAAHQ